MNPIVVNLACLLGGVAVGAFATGSLSGGWRTIRRGWARRRASLREWYSRRFGEYARLERAALPDGTRVRLVCGSGCGFREHDGVWFTSWTPRRLNDIDAPDDYKLSRDPEGNGEATFAMREVLEVVP